MQTPIKPAEKSSEKSKPWWHYGHAWLVFGGPAAVVVASLVTAYIAVSHRDPIVDEDYYQKGVNINSTLDSNGKLLTPEELNALAPAMRARNHAATGVTPP